MCINSKAKELLKKNLLFDNWALLGLAFGYPTCCIEEFMTKPLFIDEENYKVRSLASDGSGFIPCGECAKKVKDGHIELKDLITFRTISQEFPNDDLRSYEEINEIIQSTKNSLEL